MDPNANIQEQREIAAEIVTIIDSTDADQRLVEISDLASRLADLVIALDEWRSKGGYDPYA